MNNIIIKGRLVRDPELRKTSSDVSVCSFDVAVNRRFDRETADFFHCNAWRQSAEFISKYFHKGQEVLVSGEMQSRKWEADDGTARTAWEITVEQAEFCGSKADNSAEPSQKPTAKGKGKPNLDVVPPGDTVGDDLPF